MKAKSRRLPKLLTMHSISPMENLPSFVTSGSQNQQGARLAEPWQWWRWYTGQQSIVIITLPVQTSAHRNVPLRSTPRCFNSVSSISRDPISMHGVVPHTITWYCPTCEWNQPTQFNLRVNMILHFKPRVEKITQICPNVSYTNIITDLKECLNESVKSSERKQPRGDLHLRSIEHAVESGHLINSNGSDLNNLSNLQNHQLDRWMVVLDRSGCVRAKQLAFWVWNSGQQMWKLYSLRHLLSRTEHCSDLCTVAVGSSASIAYPVHSRDG